MTHSPPGESSDAVHSTAAPEYFDVVVIGGGPAGSAAARLLATWGYAVALLIGPPAKRPPGAESLPPSVRKPLAAVGLLQAVEDGGFIISNGNTASWAGSGLRKTLFEETEPGLQVRRDQLDWVLQEAAVKAGAQVIRGAARLVRTKDQTHEPWAEVEWSGSSSGGVLRAPWVLDCSGRAGILARRRLRIRQPGPATVALSAVWRSADRWDLPDPSHTLVESYRDGWAWSVPISQRERHVAVMIDPRATTLSRAAGLEETYRGELPKALHHRRLLGRAELVMPPWACTATPYGALKHWGPGFLLVGDAGSFIDPLSSFGVKKALASAWLAAIVVNTSFRSPEMEAPALSLFEERERAAHAGYAGLAAEYYAEAAQYYHHPFWTSRANVAEDLREAGAKPTTDSERVLRDARVPAAIEFLRRAPRLDLRLADGVVRDKRPVVNGREVVFAEHLVGPAVPNGIGMVRGIDLPLLVDLLSHHHQVPDLYDAWRRERAPAEMKDFLGALSVLIALDLVESS